MAEAEDVIVDAARHATSFLQEQWRKRAPAKPTPAALAEHAQRLELLVAAAFERPLKIRPAQPPAPRTLLRKLFDKSPVQKIALPATDGESIWLPETLDTTDAGEALARYRVMALRQGMRALRGAAAPCVFREPPLVQDFYLLLEAAAADDALGRLFPGTRKTLPPPDPGIASFVEPIAGTPQESLARARDLAARFSREKKRLGKSLWTGELREPVRESRRSVAFEDQSGENPTRSAKLKRTPKVREARPGEDEAKPGAFMVQTEQPHEHAEDPLGMSRPVDRDDATSAQDLAESLADLPEARLVTRPGSPKEVLLSAEPPKSKVKSETKELSTPALAYPEWDYRIGGYRTPGAIVRTPAPALGDAAWAAATLERHAGLLGTIRRRFELLKARRVRLRRQLDGEEIDLDACLESMADFRAGLPRSERLYQTLRPARREMALALLIDVSGSTDSWVSGTQRVIDVEREALLLVCIALEAMGEPYTVQAFSGEGPGAVTVRSIKGFDERHGEQVSRRIAALEPERYTRVGAALRHATALLMRRPARHRLRLLLSDGKPNDIDLYDGRYGVEDMRQAVLEAKLQGVFPFCLTVDRAAAGYLGGVFGASQYALLHKPELLPTVLLDWIRRLAS
jgi:nitric oxide reductase NorD protein